VADNVRRVQAKNRWHAAWLIVRESFRHPKTETIIEDQPTEPPVPTCYVCGKVLDLPPTGYYPTREEYERQTMPAMAMVRAMEVMEVHRNHG
jgi:hypothetical protein